MQSPEQLKRAARKLLWGERRSISIGRSHNTASVTRSTPVTIVAGNQAPVLEGLPHLKTQFQNAGFSKTLYTPSTLRIVVGQEWEASI